MSQHQTIQETLDYLTIASAQQYPDSQSRLYVMNRKINDNTAKDFMLGHSGDRILDGFSEAMTNRVVCPVLSASGRIVAFSGRDFSGRDKSQKCYKSYGFRKATSLYGIHKAWKPMKESGYCIIVEGEFDCMKMHQIGFVNTVSIMGSDLSLNQAAYIKMYCNNVFVLSDNDDSGKSCFNSATKSCKNFNMAVHNMAAVAYDDCQDTGVSDPDELIDFLSTGTNPFEYLLSKKKEATNLN